MQMWPFNAYYWIRRMIRISVRWREGGQARTIKGTVTISFFSFSYVVYIHGNITRLAGHSYDFFGNSYMRFVDQCSFIGISDTFSF